MKRLIKSSVTDFPNDSILTSVPKDHVIVIDVSYQFDDKSIDIAASTDMNEIAKTEFQSFVINIVGALDQYEFDIVDKHRTNRKGSLSYYISFYPKDENGQIQDKYIVFFGLSTHDIPDLEAKSRRYHENMAEKHKRSNERIQPYDFVNIVIDGKIFSTYSAAVGHVYDLIESMYTGKYWS